MNVLFLVCNRPDLTRRVFQRIRKAKPERLFLAADGPRPDIRDQIALHDAEQALLQEVDAEGPVFGWVWAKWRACVC
jgi:hypothetical protein